MITMNLPPPDEQFQPPPARPAGPQPSSQPPARAGWQAPVPPPQGGPPPQVPPPWQPNHPYVQPKSPGVAVLVSFFLPGVGSMISGNGGIGALILILWVIAWVLSFFLIGIPFLIGFWIWGMIQGYNDAVRWNRSHGIVS
jgi:TM2 domain-containing membrane protein YozV